MTFDTVAVEEPAVAAAPATTATAPAPETVRDDETYVSDRRGPRWRRRPTAAADADEPLAAEREAAYAAEPKTVAVGPHPEAKSTRVEE
jgi:hypothetical protein